MKIYARDKELCVALLRIGFRYYWISGGLYCLIF